MSMKLEQLIDKYYDELNENDLYIWKYILRNKKECQSISLQGLAACCHTSHATVQRFVQKLGFQGFSEFKYFLKWDGEEDGSFGKNEVEEAYYDFIRTLQSIKDRDCSDIFSILEKSKRIFIYGSGEVQKNAAREFKRCFTSAGIQVHNIEGGDELNTIVNYVNENDVFLLLSFSGNNKAINSFAKCLKEKGIKIIAITASERNELEQVADIHFHFRSKQVETRIKEYGVFMVSHFFLVTEMLFLKYLEYLG